MPNRREIPLGSFLTDFLFQFDSRIGPVPFTASCVNPSDANDPLIYNGTSEPSGYRVYLPMVLK
jgi:hypothetical protein